MKSEVDFPDGHKGKALNDGQCVVCSNCQRIQKKFGAELDANPELSGKLKKVEADLDANIKKMDDPNITPEQHAKLKQEHNSLVNDQKKMHDDLLEHKTDRVQKEYDKANPTGGKKREDIKKELDGDGHTGENYKEFNQNTGRFNTQGGSKRQQYMGSTPGKDSSVGKAVIARMRKMEPPKGGRIRKNPRTGKDQVYGKVREPDGAITERWFDMDKADMGHHPKDAVDFWNNGDPSKSLPPGKDLGPKHADIRDWMNDPDNYQLQHYSYNRSMGGGGLTYDPPTTGI